MTRKTVFLCTTALIYAGAGLSAAGAQPATPGAPQPDASATPAPGAPVAPNGERVAAAPAAAANADETIVVTGIRASLASSQSLKQRAPQQIDAVVAEDIGKLPDITVAETAARIPGVQVYRQGGEVSNVTVRGLDRPFYTTTYNGREIFTAEVRTVALQDFPSPNIAALEVYKTSTADLVEPGLAGLVNVRSRKPFDFKDGEIAASAYADYTRNGGKYRPNGDLLLTKRFDTNVGEMGFLIDGSYQEFRSLDAEVSNTDFIANPTIVPGATPGTFVPGPGTAPGAQQIRLPDIQREFYRSHNTVRPSVNGAFQWKPTPELQLYADGLWQGFRNRIDDRLLEVDLYQAQQYSNLTFRPGTNLVTGGTILGSPNQLFSFQGATQNSTDTFQFGTGGKYDHDRVHVSFDGARTISTFRGSTESIDRRFIGTPTINFNSQTGRFDVTGVDVNSQSNQLFQGLYEENQRSAGRGWQGRGDLTYDTDLDWLKNFQVGIRYTDRTVARDYGNRYGFVLPSNINASALPIQFAESPAINTGDIPNQFSAPDYQSVRDNVVALRQFVAAACAAAKATDPGCQSYINTNGGVVPYDPRQGYSATENTFGGYIQANLRASDRLDGVVGLRIIRTKTRVQSGTGPTGIAAIDNGTNTVDFLPNASVNVHISDKVQFRLSLTKTRTLADFTSLDPNLTINPATGTQPIVGTPDQPRTGGGGNPFLKPFTSVNQDASLEYYISKTAFVSAALFNRDVNGFIVNRTYRIIDPTLGVVDISGPVNSGAGTIRGVELAGQSFLDIASLPAWARGFGVQANLTFIDARLQQDNGNGQLIKRQITGLTSGGVDNGVSKWNYNIIGIYEYGPASVRLAYNGRSSYPALDNFRGDDTYLSFGRPADRLDLSVNVDLGKNVTVFGDWLNITRQQFGEDFSSARAGAPRAEYLRYDRYDESAFNLGVRVRFGS